jgi:DNA-binding NarL/FixJ family response regulator
MEVCGEAENAQDALLLIRSTSPDMAIIDITLKESSGLELIKSIRGLDRHTSLGALDARRNPLRGKRASRWGWPECIVEQPEKAVAEKE